MLKAIHKESGRLVSCVQLIKDGEWIGKERETFYDDMIWLLNGNTIGKNIYFKTKIGIWKWAHSILKVSKKPLFIDFNEFIIKINKWWVFKKRTYFEYTEYTKINFLHLYGDLFDNFTEKTRTKNGV